MAVENRTQGTPKELRAELLALEDEIQRRSEALPPDDKLLVAWRERLDDLWEHIQRLRRDARNALWLLTNRVGARLDSLRDATAAFRVHVSNGQAFIPVDGATRTALAEAIGGVLGKSKVPSSLPVPSSLASAKVDEVVLVSNSESLTAPPEPSMGLEESHELPIQDVPRDAVASATPDPVPLPPLPAIIPRVSQAQSANVAAGHPTSAVATNLKPIGRRWRDTVSLETTRLVAVRAQRTDPIVAYVGRLARSGTFDEARDLACTWMRSRRFKLPADVSSDFECRGPGEDKAIAVRHEGIWALQVDTFDQANKRRWRLEMVLVDDPSATPAVSLVLYATGPADQPPPEPTIPRLAGDLIDRIGLIDLHSGDGLTTVPERVDCEGQVSALVSRLQSPLRRHPIIVLAEYHKGDTIKTLMDPDALAVKLRGLAHVVVLDVVQRATWMLTDHLSKRFAVFGPAVRVFRPGFTTEDPSARHPFWTPQELASSAWTLAHLEQHLLREAASDSLNVLDRGDEIPAFDFVLRTVFKKRMETVRRAAKESLVLPASVVDQAGTNDGLVQQDGYVSLLEQDNEQLAESLQRMRSERDQLKAKVFYLEDRVRGLENQRFDVADSKAPLPETWENLEDWAADHLGGRVIVTPKAARAARSSPFEDVPFAYEVLVFLARTYVPIRCGELEGGKEVLESEKKRLGIAVSAVGNAVSMHRYKDAYSVNYKGRTVPLDMHVTGSDSRDPRYGFRVYFYWDEQDKCVVVGSFPNHLDNTLS
jgi:hypothetical protein